MSELGDDFRAWDKQKKEKKASNLVYSTNLLIENGIEFESKNGGVHLIVKGKDGLIDFWPSTGNYVVRKGNGKFGRGVRNVIRLCS